MEIHTVRFAAPASYRATSSILLSATLYRPAAAAPSLAGCNGRPGLLVGHGAGSHRGRHRTFCRVACAAGFVVLGLDFRGHGDSEGVADGPLELDIAAASEFLRRVPGVDRRFLCYRGSSMGGFYGIRAAPAVGFAAMALLCPASHSVLLEAVAAAAAATSPPSGTEGGTVAAAAASPPTRWDLPALRSYYEQEDDLAAAAQVNCPVLIIHARNDEVVPVTHSLELAGHVAGEATVRLLPGGSHTSAQHDPQIHRYTVNWLKHALGRADQDRQLR